MQRLNPRINSFFILQPKKNPIYRINKIQKVKARKEFGYRTKRVLETMFQKDPSRVQYKIPCSAQKCHLPLCQRSLSQSLSDLSGIHEMCF